VRPYAKVHVTVPMIQRMADLRNAGLSYASVAKVLALDHGEPFNEGHVRWYLQQYVAGYRKSPRGRPFGGKAAA